MNYCLAVFIVLLTGCGYDYNEINASKAACANAGGRFSVGTFGTSITAAYCSVDRVKYQIGRTTYEFMSGEQE